jgi:hypothetical protein
MKNKLRILPTFISQLTVLAVTMDNTPESDFFMQSWCGTACCICGNQAITNNLDLFPLAKSARLMVSKAMCVSDELNYACERLTDGHRLSRSVYEADSSTRYNMAATSGLLNSHQCEHPHLTGKSSPEIASDYIRMLISIVSKPDIFAERIILNKAPLGATHYLINQYDFTEGYFKLTEDCDVLVDGFNGWETVDIDVTINGNHEVRCISDIVRQVELFDKITELEQNNENASTVACLMGVL